MYMGIYYFQGEELMFQWWHTVQKEKTVKTKQYGYKCSQMLRYISKKDVHTAKMTLNIQCNPNPRRKCQRYAMSRV